MAEMLTTKRPTTHQQIFFFADSTWVKNVKKIFANFRLVALFCSSLRCPCSTLSEACQTGIQQEAVAICNVHVWKIANHEKYCWSRCNLQPAVHNNAFCEVCEVRNTRSYWKTGQMHCPRRGKAVPRQEVRLGRPWGYSEHGLHSSNTSSKSVMILQMMQQDLLQKNNPYYSPRC